MEEITRDRAIGCARARTGKLLLAAVLMSAALTACGGDSDSAPAAAAPPAASAPPTASAPPIASAPPAVVEPPPAAAPPVAAVEPPPASPDENEDLTGVSSAQGSTTLSWTPPTENDDGTPLTLTGYKIYWGLTEGNYPHSVTLENPGLTRHVVEQLSADTWYFVATALSADGESPPSNVVRMEIL
jgi:hypothetical protein